MSAAARYQTTGINIDGTEYRISIYDNTYSGSVVSDFILDSNLFELRYDSGSNENFTPIIGSELTLNIVLAKNGERDDTTLFTFLKNMIAQNTQKYYIVIEEKISGSFVQYWRGNVVQNQSAWMNDALEGGKIFTVTANDFAFLNEKPFELFSTAPSYYSLRSFITLVLNRLGVFADFTSGIEYFLLHNLNWFESTIPVLDRPDTDILDSIVAYDSSFLILNDDQSANSVYTTEVLKTICTIFGARIIQSNGKFYIIQLQNYTGSTSKFFQRDLDYNNPTTPTISPRVAVNNASGPLYILQGGQYTAIRPAYSVFIVKPSETTLLVPDNKKQNYSLTKLQSTNTGIFLQGGNNSLGLSISLDCWGPPPAGTGFTTSALYVRDSVVGDTFIIPSLVQTKITLRLKQKTTGTFYYLRTNTTTGLVFWSTTSGQLIINESLLVPFSGPIDLAIETPAMPDIEIEEVFCEVYPYIDGLLGGITPTTSVESYFTGTFSLKFLENGTDEQENTTYRAKIDPKPFDPFELELEKPYLYDTQTKTNMGNMYLNTGSGLVLTNNWAIGGSLDTFNLLSLAVINGMAMNASVKEIIQATVKGQYYPHQLLTYDSKQWHLKQATYNAGSNQWNGEWFELTYSETGISTVINTGNGSYTDTALEG